MVILRNAIFTTVLLLFSAVAFSGNITPPALQGEVGRFQIYFSPSDSGVVNHTFLLDTKTGRVWEYVLRTTATGDLRPGEFIEVPVKNLK